MKDQNQQAFIIEAREILAELESALLELEDDLENRELIEAIFRYFHTIKGSGSMFGFTQIAEFTHNLETTYAMVSKDSIKVTNELISLTLAAIDEISAMLDEDDGGGNPDTRTIILSGFHRLQSLAETNDKSSDPLSKAYEKDFHEPTYRLRFRPDPQILKNGTNLLKLLADLMEIGRCEMLAHTSMIPPLEELVYEECYVFWDIIITTDKSRDEILEVFDFVREDCELKLDLIDEDSSSNMGDGYKKLGEILLERGDLTREAMQEILSKQKRFGELAIESGIVAHESIESALKEQERVKTQRKSRQLHESVTSMRVSASKLDMLVNLVGELVTVQARLTETAIKRDNAEFIAIAEEVERLTANLRDNTLNIRMLPIGSTFSKFRRLVRDLSGELGKKIEMTNHGAETELDKTIIEQLNDPLIHIIRNCIDHGIEMPEERKEAGKPRHGTIHISALHSGDNVVISIKDDGRGLDKEAITAKAIKKGLVSPTAKLTDDEIYAQVFTSGFSTAKQVTSISGRGVGMNVVKRAIEDLRGSISIKSTPKVGTTITIKIPLTLAIIESLLVRIGDDNFVMPLSVVNDVVEMTPEALAETHGRNLAKVRGSIIPYIPLGERFGIRCTPPDDIPQVVIVNVEGQLIGVMVDQVIGEHHTVIKSLGSFYKNVHGVSGATIMGDGSVALILDIPQLMHNFEEELETIQESERQAGVGLNVGRYRNVIKTSDQSNVEFEGGIS